MLKVDLDEVAGIATLEPEGELSEEDFSSAAKIIDPYIEKAGQLRGLIIHTKAFPGWDSFTALIAHLKFVKEHHQKVAYIAFATDSPVGAVAEKIASHFINAEIKKFAFIELDSARNWILAKDIR